ncbi:MAG TPA: RluA family pseudouridine synthase [Pseudobacteroides sp.]|uniref:RluA family pseudouridine synthase n=1 Tax=Pseudobacteroides sp. TaxID=1968840 RepID=UPI002F9524F9
MKNSIKINLIYEDNHVLVIEKPVNLPTQKDQSEDLDLLTLLKDDLKLRYNKPGNVFLGLVHRLDRPVGGVMVFAKTSKAASRLSDQIRKREFSKVYYAVTIGTPTKLSDTLKHYLLKNTSTNQVKSVSPGTPESKEAILSYDILSSMEGLSLARVKLHTGRPHQIRVQFSTIGHPLYGDAKYGSAGNVKAQIALWSREIGFKHPTQNENMTFTSQPPDLYPWNLFPAYNI